MGLEVTTDQDGLLGLQVHFMDPSVGPNMDL